VSVIPLDLQGEVFLAMVDQYTVYLDESGTDGRSAAVAMGGYIAKLADWTEFQIEWQAMLDKDDVRAFHMTDLMAFQGEYKKEGGWDADRREAFLQTARDIIHSRTLFGFATAIITEDCEKVLPLREAKKKLRKKFTEEYELCTLMSLVAIKHWAERNHVHGLVIEYVFESTPHGRHQAERQLKRIKNQPLDRKECRLLDYDFKDKRTINKPTGLLQLHAPDMLVHQVCRQITNSPTGLKADVMHNSLRELIRSQDRKLYYFDKTNLPLLSLTMES
jgi:hypothetical protein